MIGPINSCKQSALDKLTRARHTVHDTKASPIIQQAARDLCVMRSRWVEALDEMFQKDDS